MNKKFGFIVERDFYLVTALPSGRFLSRVAENKLKIKVRNGMTNQKWWFDQKTKTVRSRQIPSQAWNILGNGGQKNLSITTANTNYWWQSFKYENNRVINLKNTLNFSVDGG